MSTQFLKSTGLLDAYETVIEQLITQDPQDSKKKSVHERAADLLLAFQKENKDYLDDMEKLANPGNSDMPI